MVDSTANVRDVDYPIPANTRSLRFYHTFGSLAIRACRHGAELRADLEAYAAQPEAEARRRDGQWRDGGERRGGPRRGRGDSRGAERYGRR